MENCYVVLANMASQSGKTKRGWLLPAPELPYTAGLMPFSGVVKPEPFGIQTWSPRHAGKRAAGYQPGPSRQDRASDQMASSQSSCRHRPASLPLL